MVIVMKYQDSENIETIPNGHVWIRSGNITKMRSQGQVATWPCKMIIT